MTGDTCTYYANHRTQCGGWDTHTFIASHECVECGGGICIDGSTTASDQTGDTCEWYWGNEEKCGYYDDEDFKANEMCCACQGDRTHFDISHDATDKYFDSCAWYNDNPRHCGSYDDEDFKANELCGICFYRAAVLTGLKAPHPMVNLGTDNKLGVFSLAGQKKFPMNLAECVDIEGDARDAY